MNTITSIQWIVPRSFSLQCFSDAPFLQLPFHFIYYYSDIISTTHVQVRFQELLIVPSNPSQNLQLVAVRLLNHYSGITSTLMRLESQLRHLIWRQQFLKIFVASLCSSFIQYPTPRYDTILKNVQDDKKALITSNLHLRGDFPPRTYFGLSYTIIISYSDFLPIMIFIWPSSDWAIGSQAQYIQF